MSERINEQTAQGDATLPTEPAQVARTAATVEVPTYLPRQTFSQLLRNDLGFLPVLLTLVAIWIFFDIVTGGVFFEARNLSFLTLQIVTIGILGLGATLVLLLGEIDLSLAAVGTLCAVVMGIFLVRYNWPPWAAILVGLLAGALVGFINGVLIAILRIPSFIVTLAASIGYSGLLLNLLQGQTTLTISDPFILSLANKYLPDYIGIGLPLVVVGLYVLSMILKEVNRRRSGLRATSTYLLGAKFIGSIVVVGGVIVLFESYAGVPNSPTILVGLVLIFWIILTKTKLGRHIYAVGGNAEATRRAGINVPAIRVIVFTLCSTLAALGGILAASRGFAVESQIDPTLLLDAIAAAVIGGVSLFGGRGSVWTILLGALIIASLENGLDLKSQGSDIKQMIEGLVLLIAVAVDALVRRAQARSASGR